MANKKIFHFVGDKEANDVVLIDSPNKIRRHGPVSLMIHLPRPLREKQSGARPVAGRY